MPILRSTKRKNSIRILIFFCSRSAPSSPNQAGMSGLMTPESLSREGSPGPDGGSITLHPAPQQTSNGIIMTSDSPAQVVASHLEVKANNFTPGVGPSGHLITTGAGPPSTSLPFSLLLSSLFKSTKISYQDVAARLNDILMHIILR